MRAASAASTVRGAATRLREAGAELRRRPRAEIVAVLGALLERLRDPAGAIRARLAAELPGAEPILKKLVQHLRPAETDGTSDAVGALLHQHRLA